MGQELLNQRLISLSSTWMIFRIYTNKKQSISDVEWMWVKPEKLWMCETDSSAKGTRCKKKNSAQQKPACPYFKHNQPPGAKKTIIKIIICLEPMTSRVCSHPHMQRVSTSSIMCKRCRRSGPLPTSKSPLMWKWNHRQSEDVWTCGAAISGWGLLRFVGARQTELQVVNTFDCCSYCKSNLQPGEDVTRFMAFPFSSCIGLVSRWFYHITRHQCAPGLARALYVDECVRVCKHIIVCKTM